MRHPSALRPGSTVLLIGILSGLVACSGPGGGDAYTVRDSLGITVVESRGPAWERGEGWSLSPEPSLQIGERDGEEVFQFFAVSGGLRLPDGRVVILNAGTQTVRVFSAGGEFLDEFGGQGDGPGEFRSLSSVRHLGGDTLLIWDGRRAAFSLFTASGAFLESTTLAPPGSEQLSDAMPLPDGRVMVTTYASPLTQGGDRGVGIHRDMAPVLVFDRAGALLDTLGFYPSTEIMIMRLGPGTGVGLPPFQKSSFIAMHGDSWYVGTAERMEVSVLDLDGAVRAVFRQVGPDLSVRDADREWYRDQLRDMASTPEEQDMLPMVFSGLIFPETRAAYSAMKVDPTGAVWLMTGRHFPLGGPSPEWTVFSHEGVLLGSVGLPERFEPLDIGIDHVLGVWRDEMDVEFVRLYSIQRGPGG
jgi:hypothetical protein